MAEPAAVGPKKPGKPPAKVKKPKTETDLAPAKTKVKPAGADAEGGKFTHPIQQPYAPYESVINKMSKLFNGNIFSGRDFMRDWLMDQVAQNQGEIRIYDKSFKEVLAKELKLPKSMITEEALDYFFGNQNGVLDEEDVVSLADLTDRLDFMIPVFEAMTQAGGQNAVQILGMEDITIIDFEQDYLAGADIVGMYISGDTLSERCLNAAMRAYFRSPLATEAGKQAVNEFYAEIEEGNEAEVPQELKNLIMAAYWGAFRTEVWGRKKTGGITEDVPFELLREDLEARDKFFRGIFLDFVEGHSNPNNPDAITHDLPQDMSIETIDQAYENRLAYDQNKLEDADGATLPPGEIVKDTPAEATPEPAEEASQEVSAKA